MTRLWAFCSFYNEAANLKEWLDNVYPLVDIVLMVDGRYALFPGQSAQSDDGSLDIIKDYPDPQGKIFLVPTDGAWVNEVAKRNAMFTLVPAGDWVLYLDADERIRGDFSRTRAAMEGGLKDWVCVHLKEKETVGGDEYFVPRLFHVQDGLKYWKTHWLVIGPDGREVHELNPHVASNKTGMARLQDCWIEHLGGLRDAQRTEAKRAYYGIEPALREAGVAPSPPLLSGVSSGSVKAGEGYEEASASVAEQKGE